MVTGVIMRTSRCVVVMWIGGVGQLLPESPIHILLYQRVDQKGSKGIEGYDRLDKVKALHFVEVSRGDKKYVRTDWHDI